MARKAADLDSLIRLRRYSVDECRRALAVLFDRQAAILAHGERLAQSLIDEGRCARADPTGAGRAFPAFVEDVRRQQAQLAQILASLKVEIDKAREVLAEAYRDLKVIEEVRKSRRQAELAEENRREQIEQDEIATIAYGRRLAAGES